MLDSTYQKFTADLNFSTAPFFFLKYIHDQAVRSKLSITRCMKRGSSGEAVLQWCPLQAIYGKNLPLELNHQLNLPPTYLISDKKKTQVQDCVIFSKMLGYQVNSLNCNHLFSLMIKNSYSPVRWPIVKSRLCAVYVIFNKLLTLFKPNFLF